MLTDAVGLTDGLGVEGLIDEAIDDTKDDEDTVELLWLDVDEMGEVTREDKDGEIVTMLVAREDTAEVVTLKDGEGLDATVNRELVVTETTLDGDELLTRGGLYILVLGENDELLIDALLDNVVGE